MSTPVGGSRKPRAALKSERPFLDQFTSRTVVLDLAHTRYDAKTARQTRNLLGASQAVFASFLGVCVATVRCWEQGLNRPSTIASRFLDEIRHNPDYWRGRLRDLAKRKTSV